MTGQGNTLNLATQQLKYKHYHPDLNKIHLRSTPFKYCTAAKIYLTLYLHPSKGNAL